VDVSPDQIVLVGGCFLGSTNDSSEKTKDWQLNRVEMCFYLFLDKEQVDQLISEGAYLLTPGWLSNGNVK